MSQYWQPPEPAGGRPARRMSTSGIVWIVVGIVVLYLLLHTRTITSFDVVYFVVLVPSIILHEVSHGAVAYAFGDDTAKRAGRLTLNPIRHIDILGSIIVPILLILSAGVAFGWAKPVPVSVNRLRHPRNQSVWVSLAGPATNAVLFLGAALAYRYATRHLLFLSPTTTGIPVPYQFLITAGFANLSIGFFNLIPIPPLDGSAAVERLLPARAIPRYYRLRPFGMVIVMFVALFAFQSPRVANHLFNAEASIWHSVSGT